MTSDTANSGSNTPGDLPKDPAEFYRAGGDLEILSSPLEAIPSQPVLDATVEQRANWRLIGGGQGIHWPDIDEVIAVATLLRLR